MLNITDTLTCNLDLAHARLLVYPRIALPSRFSYQRHMNIECSYDRSTPLPLVLHPDSTQETLEERVLWVSLTSMSHKQETRGYLSNAFVSPPSVSCQYHRRSKIARGDCKGALSEFISRIRPPLTGDNELHQASLREAGYGVGYRELSRC